VGNAVPPLLAEAVGKKILELLKKALQSTIKTYQIAQNVEKQAS
jgi:hypothetical protein